MRVLGTTQVYAILGDPVKHSLSPIMQNAAFAAFGIEAIYVPFHVAAEHLPAAVAGLRALKVRGVNVTIPHKEAICPLLDRLDATARLIGAVNTVVLRDGKLVGYNTDGAGLIRALERGLGFDPAGQRVLVLGAGGAARAAVVALAQSGARQVDIANRSIARAQSLVARYAGHFQQTCFTALALNDKDLAASIKNADLIINSTSIGLSGESFNVLVWSDLKDGCVVYDMVYQPPTTALVRDARAAGIAAGDGLGMLAAQGEIAFQLWTGIAPGSTLSMALDAYLAAPASVV